MHQQRQAEGLHTADSDENIKGLNPITVGMSVCHFFTLTERQEAAGWLHYAATQWERLSGRVMAHRRAGMCGDGRRQTAAVLSAGKKRGGKIKGTFVVVVGGGHIHCPRAASYPSIFRS